MEGSSFGGLFGDPDELQRRLGEFAEQMQGAQRLAWADNAIKLAVDLTVAAPITLGTAQSWKVGSGQSLNIQNSVSGTGPVSPCSAGRPRPR